ncbi:hypothetical protein E2C01_028632 [Portunus trituberculatus]|uniref:Uncharacterized protein n=1 Tax=Portunus trituberculatus TaxID=210409 RepID=A0A5B7ES84_PORTR|nr:hypothetical protein [Portunus trituberculatus]
MFGQRHVHYRCLSLGDDKMHRGALLRKKPCCILHSSIKGETEDMTSMQRKQVRSAVPYLPPRNKKWEHCISVCLSV